MPDLRERFDELIDRVELLDKRFAERLRHLAGIVEDPQRLQENATLDLYGAYNPSQLDAAAEAVAWPAWLAFAEWLRSILILLPICLTWWGLYQASESYGRLAAARGAAPLEPFLLLWEQGFPGVAPGFFSPKFSEVAKVDFAVLSMVLLITVLVHRHRDYLESRQLRLALDLRRDLGEVLQEVSELFARTRFLHSRAGSLLQLESVVQGLVGQLEAERQRMAASSQQRDRELQVLSDLAAQLAISIGGLSRISSRLESSNVGLSGSITVLATSVEGISSQQRQLRESIDKLQPLLSHLSTQTEEAAQSLKATLAVLAQASEQITDQARTSASEARWAREQMSAMVVQVEKVATVLGAATRGAGELSKTLRETMEQVDEAGAKIAAEVGARADRFTTELDRANDQLAGSITRLVAGIGQLPAQQEKLIHALENLLPSLADLSIQAQTAGRSLNEAVDELGDSATLLSDRTSASESELRQIRDFVVDLAKRLETITDHLATATAEAGTLNAGMTEATTTLSGNAKSLSRQVSDEYELLTSQSTDLIKLLGGSGDAVREAGQQLSRSAETIATRVEELTSFLLDRGRLNDEFADRLEALTKSLGRAIHHADGFAIGVNEAQATVRGLESVLKPLIHGLGHEIGSLHDGISELKKTLSPAAPSRLGTFSTWLKRGSVRAQSNMGQGKS